MGYSGVCQLLGFWLAVVAGVTLAALVMVPASAQGPPITGDWTIASGQSVTCDNQTMDLRGDLHIDGALTLDNCTLVVWSTADTAMVINVSAGGSLRCVQTVITPSLDGHAYVLRAEPGSSLSMVGGALVSAGRSSSGDGRDSGAFIATNASLSDVMFEGCIGGIWAAGVNVTATRCVFAGCNPGAVASDGATVRLDDCDFVDCGVGVFAHSSTLVVDGCTFNDCPTSVQMVKCQAFLEDAIFTGFATAAVDAYASNLTLEGCSFQDGAGQGVAAALASVTVLDCSFLRCDVDVWCYEAFVTIAGTHHQGTSNEALDMEWSTFDIDGVTCNGSYWGLRTYRSRGVCRNLTCEGVQTPVLIQSSEEVTLEGVDISYRLEDAVARDVRGIVSTASGIVVRNATISGVRTALALDQTRGTVERVRATDLFQEGVIVVMSTHLTLRDVLVRNATDGFRISLWSDVTLEDCMAIGCRATGFNFTLAGWPRLFRCNVSECTVGMLSLGSYPYLEDCEWDGLPDAGEAFPVPIGLDCVGGGPRIVGGTFTGWAGGIRFNGSRAHVLNATFRSTALACVRFTCSTRDTVEGCLLLGAEGSVGALVLDGSPVLRANVVMGMRHGVMVMYGGSSLLLEGNTIRDASSDGVLVMDHARIRMEGNVISGCGGSAVRVGVFSHAYSSGDSMSSCEASLMHVHTGSSVEVRGASFSGGVIGIHLFDSVRLDATFCRFIDLGRGVVVERAPEVSSVVSSTDVLVEGCYFANQSAYGVGMLSGSLRVIRCTFMGNGAGVCAWNSTVDLLDPVMVGNTLFGLMTEDCTATWTVRGLCRVMGSPISSRLAMVCDGGELWLEETKVELDALSSFEARGGARVHLRDVQWLAGGAPFSVSGSALELDGADIVGVGTSRIGPDVTRGLTLWNSSLEASGSSFRVSGVGLTLSNSTARLVGCEVVECSEHCILATLSYLEMSRCKIHMAGTSTALALSMSELEADNTTIICSGMALAIVDGVARLGDCILAGAGTTSISVAQGLAVLVNTTHEQGSTIVGLGGRIEVWWYVSVVVRWANGSELASIAVWVEDAAGGRVAGGAADAGGRVGPVPVLAAVGTQDGPEARGPHCVLAQIHDYRTRRSLTLEGSVEVELRLEDLDPPVITVLSPMAVESWTRERTLELVFRAEDAGSGVDRVEIVLDDVVSWWTSGGRTFVRTLLLTDGLHIIVLRATDRANGTVHAMLWVWVETRPIVLVMDSPADGIATNATTVRVSGTVSRPDVTVRVNGAIVRLDGNSFSSTMPLEEGPNRIVVVAEDLYGNRETTNISVLADRIAPELLLTTEGTIYTDDDRVQLTGILGEGARLVVNGRAVLVPSGPFAIGYPIPVGETSITVAAVDDVGNARSSRVIVVRTEAEQAPEGSDPMEVVPFIVIVPILAVVVWFLPVRKVRRRDVG